MRKFIFLWLLVSSSAWASTDLVGAWQAARAKDPVFLGNQAAAVAGAQKARQATALWMPNVGLQATAAYAGMRNETRDATFSAPAFGSMSGANFTTDVSSGAMTQVGIVASQPIYSGERLANSRQLQQQAALADLQFRADDQQLFVRVAQRYFDVLMAEEALAALQAQKAAVGESLDIAKEQFRVGKTASTDMHEAQASFDAISAQEYALASELELKRTLFTDLTGLPVTAPADLRPFNAGAPALASLVPDELGALIERGQGDAPMIKMSEAAREIAALEVEKHKPLSGISVDLVAQYGRQNFHGGGGSSSTVDGRSGSIGVQLTVPIFTGGMRSAKHDEAVALAEKARMDLDAARQGTAQHIRAAYLAYRSGVEQVRAYEQGLLSAQAKLDATRTGQEVGARTTADVLNAQQAYFGMKNNLTRARYQVLFSVLDLASASGTADEALLRRVNGFLSE